MLQHLQPAERERVCPLGVGGKREGGDCAGRHKMVAMTFERWKGFEMSLSQAC